MGEANNFSAVRNSAPMNPTSITEDLYMLLCHMFSIEDDEDDGQLTRKRFDGLCLRRFYVQECSIRLWYLD